MLGAGKEVGSAVLESSGRDNLVDQATLGQAIFVLVGLFELDAKELGKASLSRQLEAFVFQSLDQRVDVLWVFGGDSTVVNIENDHDFVSKQKAGVKGRLLEAKVLESLADVVEP